MKLFGDVLTLLIYNIGAGKLHYKVDYQNQSKDLHRCFWQPRSFNDCLSKPNFVHI